MAKLAVPIGCRELMSEVSGHPRTSKIPISCRLDHALNAGMAIGPSLTSILTATSTAMRSIIDHNGNRAVKITVASVERSAEINCLTKVRTDIPKTSSKIKITKEKGRIHGWESGDVFTIYAGERWRNMGPCSSCRLHVSTILVICYMFICLYVLCAPNFFGFGINIKHKNISANLDVYTRTWTTKTHFTYSWGGKKKAVKKKASHCDTHDPKKLFFMHTCSNAQRNHSLSLTNKKGFSP
jgi:hypothetical protein